MAEFAIGSRQMRDILKISLTSVGVFLWSVANSAAFVAYDDLDAFRSAMERLLGKGTCVSVGQHSLECRSATGASPRIRVGTQAGGFTLEMAPPVQSEPVKYSDLANVLQYGARSSLL